MTTLVVADFCPSANVVPFPRERAQLRSCDREDTMRRARLAARGIGCRIAEANDVGERIGRLLDVGVKPAEAIDQARAIATAIVASHPKDFA